MEAGEWKQVGGNLEGGIELAGRGRSTKVKVEVSRFKGPFRFQKWVRDTE